MAGRFDELMTGMERYGVSRANMFCLDEPDRHPGFRAANDRTLAFAERSNGRLVPSCGSTSTRSRSRRRDGASTSAPAGSSSTLARRRFQLNDERLSPIFAIAAERECRS